MDELKQHLNRETARMPWRELQTFFASGQVLLIDSELDLISVAAAIAQDDASQVADWQRKEQLSAVSDSQAKTWYDRDAEVWTVVVKPWLLVQDAKSRDRLTKS